jgi:hypothetical protein
MYPYRIRLRGPWECEPLAGPTLPPPRRMNMPCRWRDGGLGEFAGTVRFSRRFGLPRQIDPHERLWLTFAGVADTADVHLNGRHLGRHTPPDQPFEFEVTSLLDARNELVVEVEASGGHGGLWGEVALEVRCSAYLRDVRFWTSSDGVFQAAGQVVGAAERPLDLYLLLDGSTAAYAVVQAQPAGTPFELTSDPLAPGRRPAQARVELVNGGCVWYSAGWPGEETR